MNVSGRQPCFDGTVVLILQPGVSIAEINKLFSDVEEYPDHIEVTLEKVKNVHSWYVDDLLSKLFSQCNIHQILELMDLYQATVLIDIAVYHYDSYPALIFESDNMALIHKLNANLSIDMY